VTTKIPSQFSRVVDIDPDLLARVAVAQAHAAKEGIGHVLSEMTGNVDVIVETLAPEGPYGYTIRQKLLEDGSLRVPVLSTRRAIYDEYKTVRGLSDILGHSGIIDIRAPWYLFHDSINLSKRRSDGRIAEHNTLVLCPVKGSSTGITGEIFWYRSPSETLGREKTLPTNELNRRALLKRHHAMHETLIEALRTGDVETVVSQTNASVQMAVRDYVEDTGTLTQPEDKVGKERDMVHAYWSAFFRKFEILAIEQIQRVIEEWYVFAELRFTVKSRNTGEKLAWHTADFHVPGKDGLFIAWIGHGTDISPAA
jgi:hypothetical protein